MKNTGPALAIEKIDFEIFSMETKKSFKLFKAAYLTGTTFSPHVPDIKFISSAKMLLVIFQNR